MRSLLGYLLLAALPSLLVTGCRTSSPTTPNDSAVLNVTIDQGPAIELGVDRQTSLSATVTVTGDASRAVSWSATCGTVEPSGEVTTYTAPSDPATCEVTAESVADPSKSGSVTVTVLPSDGPPETILEVEAGSEEEEWELDEGILIGLPRSLFLGSTPVTVTVSHSYVPGQPTGLEPVGAAVSVEFAREAMSSDMTAAIFFLVPPSIASPASIALADLADAPTVMETRIALADGSDFVSIGYYDLRDSEWQFASVDRNLIEMLSNELGLPETVKVTVQPVDITQFNAEAELMPLSTASGLHHIDGSEYSWSSMQTACPDDGNRQSLPTWVTPVSGPVDPSYRQPVILIHGWQVLSNIAAGTRYWWTPWKYLTVQRSFVPLVCAWQQLIDHFFESGHDANFDLYSFGYDSDLSVEYNAAELARALNLAFSSERAVLIAHSMGGLVANTHIVRNERANVAALLTLGTPYLGSSALVCMEAADGYCSKAQVHPTVKASQTPMTQLVLSAAQSSVTKHQGSRDLTWASMQTWQQNVFGRLDERESTANPWLASLNMGASTRDLSFYTSFFGDIDAEPSGDETYDGLQGTGFTALGQVTDGIVPVESATLDWSINSRTRWDGLDHGLLAGGGEPTSQTPCGDAVLSVRETRRCTVLGEIAQWMRQNVGYVTIGNTGLATPTDIIAEVSGPFGYRRSLQVPFGFDRLRLAVQPGTYTVSANTVDHPRPGLEYRPFGREVVIAGGRGAYGGVDYWLYGGAAPTAAWTRQIGTPNYDVAWGVAVDADGNVLVAGDTNGPLAAPGHGTRDRDAFVRKLSPTGEVLWTQQFGSSSSESARAVATNPSGDVAVAGWTWGGLNTPINGWYNDAFLRIFDSDGDELWTAQFGGGDFEHADYANYAMDVAFDTSGDVVIGGDTVRRRDDGYYWTDIFINKYSADGTLTWSYVYGIPDMHVYSSGIAVDTTGSVVIGAYTPDYEAVVVKVNSAGVQQWVRRFGSCSIDDCVDVFDVATDPWDNVLVTGSHWQPSGGRYLRKYDAHGAEMWTHSLNLHGQSRTGLAVDERGDVVLAGDGDLGAGIVKIDASGSALWATWFGTGRGETWHSADKAHDVALAPDGAVVVVGETTVGIEESSTGGVDAYVRKYGP